MSSEKVATLEEVDELSIDSLIRQLNPDANVNAETNNQLMVVPGFSEVNENVTDEARYISAIAALVWNVDAENGRLDKGKIQDIIGHIDHLINQQINEIIHNDQFKELESTWRGLFDLIADVNFQQTKIDILDVSKEELSEDFQTNSINFIESAFFDTIYTKEYDQLGGEPYGCILGMYSFSKTPEDLAWLKIMGQIAKASHAPFISSISPQFFGCKNISELDAINDLEGEIKKPEYGGFDALRNTEEAAYIGLTLPSYVLRLPWDPVENPCKELNFKEDTTGGKDDKYLWGNSAVLFGKNLIRSFQETGWCQTIRGVEGGGLIEGLPVHTQDIQGIKHTKMPVEMMISGTKEYAFSKSGFIPFVYRKESAEGVFMASQSIKKAKEFVDPNDSENAQLACNLSYTFTISRIAHYVQWISRDKIGTNADADYLQKELTRWIMQYVTTIVNPDERALRRFPLKAANITVKAKPGKLGQYDCKIEVLPHVQFEGMEVKIVGETRLGKKS